MHVICMNEKCLDEGAPTILFTKYHGKNLTFYKKYDILIIES
jgi:hypothetical protein